MRFEVLGPLQVTDVGTGARTLISAPRLRVLLAALLLYANQPVPVGELAELVWDGDPPPGAANSVRAYVMRLRRVLGAGVGVRIVTRDPGYLVQLAEAELDVLEFEALCARAGVATAAQQWAEVSVTTARALGFWRSSPLIDIPAQDLRDRWVPRLERLHLQALDWRLDAELHLGRHDQLVPQLRELCRQHPLRERFQARLMLALAGCGQRGEALQVYQQARRGLVEELGIEPGTELRDAQQRILAGTADAEPPPVAESGTLRSGPLAQPAVEYGSGVAVPRQLPAAVRHFTARERELLTLTERLEDRGPVVISAIGGTAGVGKTALAVHWAHQVAARFPDGQLYVNLRGFDPGGQVVASAAAVRGFLGALGVPAKRIPADLDAQAALYRSLLAGRRMLVVIDNARDAEHARPLLPGTPTAFALVTSRNQLTPLVAADGAHPLALDLLSDEEARELLASRIDRSRVAAEPEAVEQIIGVCARLPLALALVAARAATHPTFSLAALATELSAAGDRTGRLDTGDVLAQVRAVFSWSYTTLTPPAAGLFRLLGLHPGPEFSAAAAASLAATPPADARQLLVELTCAGLLVEHAPGRYGFHDLLRAYAADLASSVDHDGELRAATTRLLDHYTHTAHTAGRLLDPARNPMPLPVVPPAAGAIPEHPNDPRAALGWLTAEHPVLQAAQRLAAGNGFDTHTWQLAWAIEHTFLDRHGHWHELGGAWQIALAAADRLGNLTATAYAHRRLAHASTRLGGYDQARTHLRHALDLFTGAGDLGGQAHTHHTLGILWERLDRPDRALDHTQQALALYRAVDDRHGQALALNGVGWCFAVLGDYAQAIARCQQALTLLQQDGDRDGEAPTWDSLGYAHHHLAHHSQAVDCYQHALSLYRDLGHRYYEADTLTHLGDTHHAAGQSDAARTAWIDALGILTDIDHPDADAVRAKLRALEPAVNPL